MGRLLGRCNVYPGLGRRFGVVNAMRVVIPSMQSNQPRPAEGSMLVIGKVK